MMNQQDKQDPNVLDPIVLALVQNRLDHISRQMGWVMTRTARSPIFSQSHDFSCFIADPDGTLVSQADGIPIHTGGVVLPCEHCCGILAAKLTISTTVMSSS